MCPHVHGDSRGYQVITHQFKVSFSHLPFAINTNGLVECNACIFVKDLMENSWEMKGQFSKAVQLQEDVPWEFDGAGKAYIHILAVSCLLEFNAYIINSSFQEIDDITSMDHLKSCAVTPASASDVASPTTDTLQNQIVTFLKIPVTLTVRPKIADICISYAKYQAIVKAQANIQEMVAKGTWTLKRLTSDKLVEVFVSKTVWHAHYQKLFPRIKAFPLLVKWLENAEDAPSTFDLFGFEKGVVLFKDLKDFLETHETA